MTTQPNDDEALIGKLRALYQSEVSRARRDIATRMPPPGVRPARAFGGPTIAAGVIFVLAAAMIFVGQRSTPSGSPQATDASSGSVTQGGAPPSSVAPDGSQTVSGSTTEHTFQIEHGTEVIDRSGLVTHARALAPFEFVAAPPKAGVPFAFNLGGIPSTGVRVIWFGSGCGTATTVTIDKAIRTITVAVRGVGPQCADLRMIGLVLEFKNSIDASRVAVTISSK
jgi:hypothetical protein